MAGFGHSSSSGGFGAPSTPPNPFGGVGGGGFGSTGGFGGGGGGGGFGNSSSTPSFGGGFRANTPSTSNATFGNSFGSPRPPAAANPTGFGSPTGGFGTSNAAPNTPSFGVSGFGQTSTNTAAPMFGATAGTTAPSGFPQPGFGTNTNNPPTSGFGGGGGATGSFSGGFGGFASTNTTANTPFGGSSTGSGATAASGFGNPPTTPNSFQPFGSPSTTASGFSSGPVFGNAPTAATGSSFGGGGFGAASSSQTPFGQPPPTTTAGTSLVFGASSTTFMAPPQPSMQFGSNPNADQAMQTMVASDNEDMADGDAPAPANNAFPFGPGSTTTASSWPPTSTTNSNFAMADANNAGNLSPIREDEDDNTTANTAGAVADSTMRSPAASPPPPKTAEEDLAERKAKLEARLAAKRAKLEEHKRKKSQQPAASADESASESLADRNAARFAKDKVNPDTQSHLPTELQQKKKSSNDQYEDYTEDDDDDDGDDDGPKGLEHAVALVGICPHMCPNDELLRREREGDIQLLELPQPGKLHPSDWTLRNTAVKRFRRSAADYKLDVPEWVRPPDVLEQVCAYLEEWVMERDRQGFDPRFAQTPNGPPSLDVYQFIWDRTRMVRKDFTLQNYVGTGGKCDARAVRCHERIARWHAMCEHQLSHIQDFAIMQSQQNIQELGQTMKTLNQYYDDSLGRSVVEVPDDQGQETRTNTDKDNLPPLHGCKSNAVQGRPPVDYDGTSLVNENSGDSNRIIGTRATGTAEPEFRGLYILLTMNNDGGMEVLNYVARLFRERPEVYHSRPVQLALSIFKAKKENNYARFFSILRSPSTPYLFACIMFKHVGTMRNWAFRVMSKTFGARKKGTGEHIYDAYPLKHLVHALCFEGADEARQACQHYNITVKEMKIRTAASSSSSQTSSSSATTTAEIVFWRHSDFEEPRDPEKGTIIPLRPWKMVKTIESKLKGATRLGVCRGDVSGEGATLSQVPLDRQALEQQLQQERAARAASLAAEQERRREEQLKQQQRAAQEAERNRLELEARKKAEEERQHLLRQLQEQQRRQEEEKLRLEELRKKQLQQEKERKKLEQERAAKEAARKRQEEEAAKMELLRKQQAERAAAEAAAKKKAEQEELERQREKQLQEAKRLVEEKERQRIKANEEKRMMEERERIRREEEARQRELKRTAEEANKRMRAEARRIALEWEEKVDKARKLLLWRRWRQRLSRHIQITEHSKQSLKQIDPTFSQGASPVGAYVHQAIAESVASAKHEKPSESSHLATARLVLERLLQAPIAPINFATAFVEEMATDKNSQFLSRQRKQHCDDETVILIKVAIVLPKPNTTNELCTFELVNRWIDSQLIYGEVCEDTGVAGGSHKIQVRAVTVNGHSEEACCDCDAALFVLPPPWSSESMDNADALESMAQRVEADRPRVALVLTPGKDSSVDMESTRQFFASHLGGSQEELCIAHPVSLSESSFHNAFVAACKGLAQLFASDGSNLLPVVERIPIMRLGSMVISAALWRHGNFIAMNQGESVVDSARDALRAMVSVLESTRSDQEESWSSWPSREFVRDDVVKDYFAAGAHLPMAWPSSLRQENIEPLLSEVIGMLQGRLSDVVASLLIRAPEAVCDECDVMLEKRQFRRCLEHALLWWQGGGGSSSLNHFLYLPVGVSGQVIDDAVKPLPETTSLILARESAHLDTHPKDARHSGSRGAGAEPGPTNEEPRDSKKLVTGPFATPEFDKLGGNKEVSRINETMESGAKRKYDGVTSSAPEDEEYLHGYRETPASAKRRRVSPVMESKDVAESAAFTKRLEALVKGETLVDMDIGDTTLSALLRNAPIKMPQTE